MQFIQTMRGLFLASVVCFLFLPTCFAQTEQYKGTQKLYSNSTLDSEFSNYRVFELDIKRIQADLQMKGGAGTIELSLGDLNWDLQLQPSGLIPDNYTLQVQTEKGVQVFPKAYEKAFMGTELNSNGHARLTIDTDYVGGYVQSGNETWFIEPVSGYDRSAPSKYFVVYEKSAALAKPIHNGCETIHLGAEKGEHTNLAEAQEAQKMICLDLQLAIASDKSMFTKYGSVTAVENHNITVMNNVETNYTGAFLHDLNFVIVTQFVVTATGTDPWTTSTAAGTFLDSFRTWGNGGGFGVTYDLAQIWTNRDFDGSTIGVAYVGTLCTSSRYQALQDFSTATSAQTRCMVAHETGHNLDMDHDATLGFIMSPSVSSTNTWSSLSVNTFATYIPPRITASCLVACAGGGGGGTAPTANFTNTPANPCTNQSITLTNTSTGTPTSYLWTMTGGTPATSTATNPTVTYSTPGAKTITLQATNASGSNTVTKTVNVSATAIASFTSSVTALTATFTFTGSSATSWTWNFGDGTTSTVQNPIHTYATSGQFQVTLNITGPCGNATLTQSVTTGPLANFTVGTQSGCAPMTVTFQDQSIGATSWSWQFQGGTPATSTQQNPVVTYSAPGIYDVNLLASNGNGTSSRVENDYINVQLQPVSNFTTSISGTTVTFNNTSLYGSQFLWNFGDGNTSTQNSPVYTYATQGSYTPTLTVTNICGSATASQNLQLFSLPVASFTAQQGAGCAPIAVQYISTSTGSGLVYTWQFPGGTPVTSTDQNPTVTYPASGTYNASLLVTNPAGGNSTQQTTQVTAGTAPSVQFTTNTTGTTVNFNNQTTGATSYAWNFGDGNTSTQANPAHTYASAGNYTVVLVATNACGTAQATNQVSVVLPPVAAIQASQTTGCSPTTIQFTGINTPGVTHNWSFAGGTPAASTLQNPVVVFSDAGTFLTTYTATNTAGSSSATQTITMGTGAVPGFQVSTNGLLASFTNQSTGASTYLWNFGNGQTSTQASPSYTYPQDGTYTVTLSATNSCGTTTATQTVTVATPPTAAFTQSATSGCTPFTVQFTNQSSANSNSFSWNFAGGASNSTAQNPSVTFTTPGVYQVALTTSNAVGNSTATVTIIVGSGANPAFSAAVNQAVATFTNTSSNATSYQWAFGDGAVSSAAAPTHTYTTDGVYTVTLTATNACGSSTTTQTVTIVTPPTTQFSANSTTGCAPFIANFVNQSSTNGNSYEWTFAGGAPSTSTDKNPSVTYSTPGTYTVILRTSNAAGATTETKTSYITVLSGPTAIIAVSTNLATLTTQNTSTNASSYLWSFGDGSTSTLTAPTHTYGQDGTYTVTLTATNSCGINTATQTVSIITPPSANFTANTTSGCGPLTVAYSNQSSSNSTSYAWTFVGGTPATSTDANPVVVYQTPGNYTAQLTVTNGAGTDTETKASFVTVNPLPTAAFTPVTSGDFLVISNQSSDATSYAWTFGDGGSSTQFEPSHVYTEDGVFTIVLTATNACGSVTSTQIVTILTTPSANFTPSVTTGCAPLNVTFQNQSSANAVTYEWNLTGGVPASSTLANPTTVFATPGTYTVTLTVGNGAGSATTTRTIVVTGPPTPAFSFVTGGLSVGLTNTTQGATSYLWSFGDGSISTDANPNHTYAGTGTYEIVLTATNACGSTTKNQTIVLAGSAPVPGFTASSTLQCAPATITFTDASVGAPTAWAWSFPGGNPATSTAQNPSVSYPTAGSYGVSLTVTNAFGTQTMNWTNQITVEQPAVSAFTPIINGASVQFQNNAQNSTNFLWSFGDGTQSLEASPTHVYAASGTYIVNLTVTNSCGAVTQDQVVTISLVGTQNPPWAELLLISPNPTSNQFELKMQAEPVSEVTMQLIDVLGRTIQTQTTDFGAGTCTLQWDVTALEAATYLLRIQHGYKSVTMPVVVVR
jgi:PKD repeat protein